MSSYTIQQNDNLWKIARREYGLKNNRDVANKVKELERANHISSPNTIFAGKTIDLVGKDIKNTAPVTTPDGKKPAESPASAATTATQGTKGSEQQAKVTSFGSFTNSAAESISGVDKDGKAVYSAPVADFDMAGSDFTNAVKAKDYDKAGTAYKEKALDTAKKEIATYDTDNDGKISHEEQVAKDKADYEAQYGKASQSEMDKMQMASLRADVIMDVNHDGKVDEKEYAAFLYAMDANNDKKTANGKISRDEYVKTAGYFDKPMDGETGTFIGTIRSCYRAFFGIDPKTGK